jgi:hypothetical protein
VAWRGVASRGATEAWRRQVASRGATGAWRGVAWRGVAWRRVAWRGAAQWGSGGQRGAAGGQRGGSVRGALQDDAEQARGQASDSDDLEAMRIQNCVSCSSLLGAALSRAGTARDAGGPQGLRRPRAGLPREHCPPDRASFIRGCTVSVRTDFKFGKCSST